MPSVLIFTMNFWPEPTGFGPLTNDLAEHLSQHGWEVTVLTGFPMAPGWRVYDGYRGRVFQKQRLGKVDIRRVWVYVPARPDSGLMKTWRRVAFDTSFMVTGLPVALSLGRQDAIIALCPPLQVGAASLVLRSFWKSPVLYWLQDIVPDAALSVGMMREGFAFRFAALVERFIYDKVDRIGIVSKGFELNLISKGVHSSKIAFLPNWVDVSRFDQGQDGQEARRSWGIGPTDFLLVHAGSVSAKQGLENVLRAMSLLRERKDIHLRIVGDGNQLKSVKSLAAQLQVSQVRFVPILAEAEYVGLLRAADALILNQAGQVKDVLLPSKLLTYLSSARPVIASVNKDSEAARFIQQSRSGVLVEPEVPEGLAQAILELQADPGRRDLLGQSGKEYVRCNCDRSVLLQRFVAVLDELVSSSGRTTE